TYRNADGSTRVEYRPDAEVTRSMQSMRLPPPTQLHPPGMLDATNARSFSVGAVGENIRRDGKWIVAPLAVHDAQTVKQMDAGELRQGSGGDECELDETPGMTPDGERYDAVQRDITINHVALVPNARAGNEAAVRMDAAISDSDNETTTRRSNVMDLAQALAALAAAQEKLGAEKSRADAADAKRTELQKRLDTVEAERDSLKETATKAEKARTDAQTALPGLVKARVALEMKAREILGTRHDAEDSDEGDEGGCNFDGQSDREIKLAVIKQVTDADIAADKSDAYVDARFDAAVERAATSSDTFRAANDIITGNHLHTDALAVEQAKTDKARADMIEANRNGWRPAGTVAQPTK